MVIKVDLSAVDDRIRHAVADLIDRRDLGVTPGPGGIHRIPITIQTFPELKPTVPIFITERDITDMDRREDSIELMERILEAQVAAEQQAKQLAAQNAARVRSGPALMGSAGLLPPTTGQDDMSLHEEGFFSGLSELALTRLQNEFVSTGMANPTNGTVVEFPTTFVPQVATSPGLLKLKKRRRRRRLLTASDKCDIAATKAMLNTAEFKIWLACPSMFKG